MSQPPLSYESLNPYSQGPQRPPMFSVLTILGIVFGGLGVLCLGFNLLFSLLAMSIHNPAMTQALHSQPVGVRVSTQVLSVCALLLAGVLLFASIGCLALKPAARRVIVGWALVNIAFDLMRLLLSWFVFLPMMSRNPVFQQNPNIQQFAGFIKWGLVLGVIMWLLQTAYSVLLYIYFRKPEVVAMFEQPPQNPNAGASLPPPPL